MNTAHKYNKKYNYEYYLQLNDDKRYEIIEGVVYDMSPAPSRRHQEISIAIEAQFYNYFIDKECRVYDAPFDVRLPVGNEKDNDIETIVQPDIVIVCDKTKLDDKGCKGAPDIIIEIISKATASKDLKEKFMLYEKHRVKEYWIIYPVEETLMVYKINDTGKYDKPVSYSNEDKIPVKMLGDLEIDLKKVFIQ